MSVKKLRGTWSFTAVIVLLSLILTAGKSADPVYYQLKVYSLVNKEQEIRMDNYLKESYLPALHRAGINKVGVFKPIEEDTSAGNIIFVLIPFNSLDQFEKLPQILAKDSRYRLAGKDYIEAGHDNPPYSRIESILLRAFRGMPHMGLPVHQTPPSERIYELRSYEGPTEQYYERKVEMFNEGGEIGLFSKLDFNAVFYAEVLSGAKMPNLMYMTTFSDQKSRDEHWKAFQNHPEWLEMKGIEKYKNTVSNITRYLLHPTDYSDI